MGKYIYFGEIEKNFDEYTDKEMTTLEIIEDKEDFIAMRSIEAELYKDPEAQELYSALEKGVLYDIKSEEFKTLRKIILRICKNDKYRHATYIKDKMMDLPKSLGFTLD